MSATEVCPICLRAYSERNPRVRYHLSYYPEERFIYACRSCNYHEYLSRHWKNALKPWNWYKIYLVRRYAKLNRENKSKSDVEVNFKN